MKRAAALVICLLLVLGGTASGAVGSGGDVALYMAEKAGCDSVEAWVDTELCELAGQSAEWFIFALARGDGAPDFSAYRAALTDFAREQGSGDTVTSLRIAMALVLIGDRDNGLVKEALGSVGERGDIMSLVFGLHLLNNGVRAEGVSVEDTVERILELACSDGGWSLGGERGDADITAMTLAALAENLHLPGVSEAVEGGLEFLSLAQLPSGDFSSYGAANAESAAQVIIALDALGIDPETDGRFVKNGCSAVDALESHRLPSGGYCHIRGGAESRIATAQAMCALTALETEGPFWVWDGPAVSYEDVTPERSGPGYRLWVCLGIGVVAAVCVSAVLIKGYSKKNVPLILVAAAAAVGLVLFTDIRPGDHPGEVPSGEPVGTVTLEIRCDTVAGRADHIPSDGCLLEECELELFPGDTVYDVLVRALGQNRLLMEHEGRSYILGIGNIRQRQYGDLSGWVYFVNGESPSVGSGEYPLSDGDGILWAYSLDMGKDISTEN